MSVDGHVEPPVLGIQGTGRSAHSRCGQCPCPGLGPASLCTAAPCMFSSMESFCLCCSTHIPGCFQRQCLLAQLLVTAEKGCPFHGPQCARLCSGSGSRQRRAGSALGPWGPRPAAQGHQEELREGHPCSWHCTQQGQRGRVPQTLHEAASSPGGRLTKSSECRHGLLGPQPLTQVCRVSVAHLEPRFVFDLCI